MRGWGWKIWTQIVSKIFFLIFRKSQEVSFHYIHPFQSTTQLKKTGALIAPPHSRPRPRLLFFTDWLSTLGTNSPWLRSMVMKEILMVTFWIKGCGWKFQGSFKGVSRVVQESFKEVSRVFQGHFKHVSRKIKECCKKFKWMFQARLKDAIR